MTANCTATTQQTSQQQGHHRHSVWSSTKNATETASKCTDWLTDERHWCCRGGVILRASKCIIIIELRPRVVSGHVSRCNSLVVGLLFTFLVAGFLNALPRTGLLRLAVLVVVVVPTTKQWSSNHSMNYHLGVNVFGCSCSCICSCICSFIASPASWFLHFITIDYWFSDMWLFPQLSNHGFVRHERA